jgi:hypothetical protein
MALTSVAVFDDKGIAGQNHRDPMKWDAMPGQGLTGRQTLTTDQSCSTMEQDFTTHA